MPVERRGDSAEAGRWATRPLMTVGEVAALLGLSVRALHHWDAVGLVRPSHRSRAGYRLYSQEDCQRLQQVIAYRETGMPLALIERLLELPDAEALVQLARQRELLEERVSRLKRTVSAVDTLIETIRGAEKMEDTVRAVETVADAGANDAGGTGEAGSAAGAPLVPEELVDLWGSFWGTGWDCAWAQEAEQRWGGTTEWAESRRRQETMTRVDWVRARDEAEALEAELAAAMRRGVVPGSREASSLAERHRTHLNRWFEVSVSRQVLIVGLYETDTFLRAHFDSRAPGLAAWLSQVVGASARSHGVNPEAVCWGGC